MQQAQARRERQTEVSLKNSRTSRRRTPKGKDNIKTDGIDVRLLTPFISRFRII
jgi:hypothetical protein